MKTPAHILGKSKYDQRLESHSWKSFTSSVIRERGAQCENCQQGNKVLQVHEIAYHGEGVPFSEIPREDLIVLCVDCHRAIHAELNRFRRYVFRHLRPEQFHVLNGALMAGATMHNPLEFVHAVAEMAASPSAVKRFAYSWENRKQERQAVKA